MDEKIINFRNTYYETFEIIKLDNNKFYLEIPNRIEMHPMEIIKNDIDIKKIGNIKDLYLTKVKNEYNGKTHYIFYFKFKSVKIQLIHEEKEEFSFGVIQKEKWNISLEDVEPVAKRLIKYLVNESNERLNILFKN